jgi:hypothetical protein
VLAFSLFSLCKCVLYVVSCPPHIPTAERVGGGGGGQVCLTFYLFYVFYVFYLVLNLSL